MDRGSCLVRTRTPADQPLEAFVSTMWLRLSKEQVLNGCLGHGDESTV
jgi:hypothetical protein